VVIAVLSPPDSTELRGNLPFGDKSGDKQFSLATETLSVPVAFALSVPGWLKSGNEFSAVVNSPR
jgi:hypothetical protein